MLTQTIPSPSFFSESDNGYRGFIPPAGVNASDGTHFDKVAVSWGTSSGASHYRLFRNTINSPTGAEPLTPWQTALACEDTDVKIGSLYYYFVASAADDLGACQSAISTGDSGYRALAPPINIYASKGQFVTLIGVSWEKGASEASHFRIYRSRENDPRTAQPVSDWKIGTYYDDTSAVSGLLYYYWVTEATDETGANESVFGNDGVGMPGFMRLIGDVDGNMTVELSDAILALQVSAGMAPKTALNTGADVHGAGKISIEEAVYVLRKIAGLIE